MVQPDPGALNNAVAGSLPGACAAAGANGDWLGAAQVFLDSLQARGYTVVPQMAPMVHPGWV